MIYPPAYMFREGPPALIWAGGSKLLNVHNLNPDNRILGEFLALIFQVSACAEGAKAPPPSFG